MDDPKDPFKCQIILIDCKLDKFWHANVWFIFLRVVLYFLPNYLEQSFTKNLNFENSENMAF